MSSGSLGKRAYQAAGWESSGFFESQDGVQERGSLLPRGLIWYSLEAQVPCMGAFEDIERTSQCPCVRKR